MPIYPFFDIVLGLLEMNSFEALNLEEFYFPPGDNVVKDFFIPVLSNSNKYDRATGYFTSYSLVELSIGICEFASKGGKMRVITSPRLTKEDLVAIKEGYNIIETIGKSMVNNFQKPVDPEMIDRLSLLSELISSGTLEIKVAVMKNLEKCPNAMFHPKFGLMYNPDGGIVSFTGSMNETQNGMIGNWDHIEVSLSHNNASHVRKLKERFDGLWNGRDDSVMILNLPKVVGDLISEYHSDKSLLDLDQKLLQKYDDISEPESVFFKSPEWLRKNRRQYQTNAVHNWIKSGYCGIFDMATGTGKTKTALLSLESLYNNNPGKNIFAVIIAPQKHLVDQWGEEVKQFGVNPIIGHSDASKDWKVDFRRKMTLYLSKPQNMCFLTTMSMFSSKEIQDWISRIDELAIVVDEAHNMGSANRLRKMPSNAKYRLALSATMERYNDSVGTFYLKEYFKTECIKLSIDDAIGKYLVNYNYYPIVCTYSDEEYDQLIEKNESLNKVLKSSVSENVKSKARRDYVEYRYTLNSKMESKFHALKSLMRKYVNDNHFLVYSGKVRTDDEGDFIEGSHSMMLKAIDKTTRILGKNCLNMKISRITYEEKASDRKKIIEDFNNGDIQGIVAISCLDEGIDIPSIKTAVIMSSSDNPREYIQRRGRVLRLFPGKDHADIYDFVVFPRDLDDYRIGGIYSEIELMVLSKEIKRMKEFSRISLNKDETDNLLQEITKVYGMTIEKIMDIAGSEDDEQC